MSAVGGVWIRTEQMHEKDRVLRWTGTKNLTKNYMFRLTSLIYAEKFEFENHYGGQAM